MKRITFLLIGVLLIAACIPRPTPPTPTSTVENTPTMVATDVATPTDTDVVPSVTSPNPTLTEPGPTETIPVVTPTITPTPAITVTPPPEPDHNLFEWHPTTNELTHSHGVNPLTTVFADFIGEFFAEYELPIVGHVWLTSAHENMWPDGKHDGFVWLAEDMTSCTQFDNGGNQDPGPQIPAYALQVHTMRTGTEIRTRFHSESVIAVVIPTGANCQITPAMLDHLEDYIVYTGGFADYGEFHTEYKRTVCETDPANPPLIDQHSADQPPYRTQIGRDHTGFFWSSLINNSVKYAYDPDPSEIIEVAWNDLDVFSSAAVGDECFNPAEDTIRPNARATTHQVFSIYLHIDDLPRPFVGWTDVHGNIRNDCSSAHDAGCVPIYIGANVPNDTAYLNRQVAHGNGDIAPIQDFYNGLPVEMNCYGYPAGVCQ